ncbi:unnamed protein product [Caenorhabditis bovis]|uniref:Adenylate kinase isoenzyme 6 homolog n=1 Tax=Caenorhabditis bovis TaxID=2654633 RepID=A0A8S1ERC5_9PELO|nr:unnamed protein product [Caenorhabditis bovis]
MSRRKLNIINYDRDFINNEDPNDVLRFFIFVEENHLRIRDENWKMNAQKNLDLWDEYLREIGLPDGATRAAAVDYVLDHVISKIYSNNEKAKSWWSEKHEKEMAELLETLQDSLNPLNKIDYNSPEFMEKAKSICSVLGINTDYSNSMVLMNAACTYILENLNEKVLNSEKEQSSELQYSVNQDSLIGMEPPKQAAVRLAAVILKLTSIEQLRKAQTLINEALAEIQRHTIDTTKKPNNSQVQYGRMATAETRRRPNILITGSPGTGKSTLSQQVAEKLGFDYIEIGKVVRENQLFDSFDEQYDCYVLDEDKLLDHIQDRMDSDDGGVVVDYHGCDFFPERWFDIVIVLRCPNNILYDRLAARGYADFKIKENIECEIFGSLAEEARDSYDNEIVHEMQSQTPEQMDENLNRICEMAEALRK